MTNSPVTVDSIIRKKRRLPRRWFWLLLILAVAGGGLWYYQSSVSKTAAPGYATTRAATGAITVTVTAVGTVEPIETVEVNAEIAGTVRSIMAAVNAGVKAGQPLAMLDTTSLEADVARDSATLAARDASIADAQATLDAATTGYERAQKMADRGVASIEALQTAKSALARADAALSNARAQKQVAEADLQLARANLAKACICAPIDGMVLDRDISLGQTVSAAGSAKALFTLVRDLNRMELRLDVDEADIGKVVVGDAASFTVEAFQGKSFPASVTELHFAPQTVEGVVTYRTILSIDNADHLLRPGMTAAADITVGHVEGVLVVPNAAFRFAPPSTAASQRGSGLLGMLFSRPPSNAPVASNEPATDGWRSLWVLKNGTATQQHVRTGVTDGILTEILEGPLAIGDAVITDMAAK